jgi:hypothetical protein
MRNRFVRRKANMTAARIWFGVDPLRRHGPAF